MENEPFPRFFPEQVRYEDIMRTMTEEFLKRWDNNRTSDVGGLDDHRILKVIGKGSFGKVMLCKQKISGKYAAVKHIHKESVVQLNQVHHVLNEKRVMQSTNFPFLSSLLFSRKNNDYLFLGMPYYANGDVFAFQQTKVKFNDDQVRFYASQIFLGLQYMHANKLVYRDLKTENLLLSLKGYIRITDFGFTKRVIERTMTFCGTPEYFAPELIQLKPYGSSVDWWGFGILIYELAAGHTPFAKYKMDPMRMFTKICDGVYTIPDTFNESFKDLVTNLLKVDPTKRYGCMKDGDMDIRNHRWFEDVNWFGILNQEVSPPIMPPDLTSIDYSHLPSYSRGELDNSQLDRYTEQFRDF